MIRHPTLRRILRVEAFCAVGAVLPPSCGAPVFMSCLARPDRYALVKGDNTTEHGASQRGRAATRLSNTERTSAHNASRPLLLTLSHCPADTSSPSLDRFCCRSPKFCQSRGTLPRDCQKSFSGPNTDDGNGFSLSRSVALSLCRSVALSLSRVLAFSLFRSVSLTHSRSLALSHMNVYMFACVCMYTRMHECVRVCVCV